MSGVPPRSARTLLERARALAGSPALPRLVEVVLWCGLGLLWLRSARDALACLRGAHFEGDDWANLDAANHLWRAFRTSVGTEVFRPLTPALFALLHAVLGLGARGFLWFFLGVNVLAALQAARVSALLGFPRGAAALAAMMVLISRITVESFNFFTQQQLTVARLLLLSAMHAVLAAGPAGSAPTRAWLPFMALALCSHEQSVLAVPLLALCLAYRDGPRALRDAARRPDVQGLLALVAAYLAMHVLWFPPSENHALSWRALPEKLDVLRSLASSALHWRDDGWLATPARLAAVLAASAWVFAREPRGWRMLAFCAAWVVCGFSVYFFALNTTAGYFYNVAEWGVALAVGTLLDRGARAPWQWLPLRAAFVAMAWMSPVALGGRDLCGHDAMDDSPRVLALVGDAMRARPPAFVPVVFVGDAPVSPDDTSMQHRYLGLLGDDFEWNDREVYDPTQRNHALPVMFPGRRARVWVLHRDDLPWLCVRRGDAAIRVVQVADRQWRYAALPRGCGAQWTTPVPGSALGDESLRAPAWRFWQAREAFDDAAERAAAAELARAVEGRPVAPGTPAARMWEAVRAVRPPR